MGAVKCLPQKEQPVADEPPKGTASAGDPASLEEQLRVLQKKFEESQQALQAQKKVCAVQEKRINEFQAATESSKSELLTWKERGGATVALSATMMKFAKEGSGKAASRKVNFLYTDTKEAIVILTTESTGAVKQYTVQGVSDDPKSASLSKLKDDESKRMLILECEGKKVPLLVKTEEVRNRWMKSIKSCLSVEEINE